MREGFYICERGGKAALLWVHHLSFEPVERRVFYSAPVAWSAFIEANFGDGFAPAFPAELMHEDGDRWRLAERRWSHIPLRLAQHDNGEAEELPIPRPAGKAPMRWNSGRWVKLIGHTWVVCPESVRGAK